MDTRLKEIVDNFEKMKIGVDEPFKFHCTMCGKCCINREDILLTPKDLYNMAKELKITPNDFVSRYCDVYVGEASRIPIVRIQPRGTIKRCPLLKDRKCAVHNAKPTVCAMSPIGRCLILKPENDLSSQITADQIQYIFTDPGCGDDTETHTVREWLGAFNISMEDEFFIQWQKAVAGLGESFRRKEKIISQNIMQMLWSATYIGLYLNYDTEQEFLPQFEDNAQKVFKFLAMVEEGGDDE